MIADVRSTAQTHNGASVTFDIYNNMTAATTALTEATDVTPVALGDTTVTVSLSEYGNAVETTAKLRGTSFLNVDADAANIIGYNMVDSLDQVVAAVAAGGTNEILPTGRAATINIIAGDDITTNQTRTAAAQWRRAQAMPVVRLMSRQAPMSQAKMGRLLPAGTRAAGARVLG